MKKLTLMLIAFLSLPFILFSHGPNKEMFDDYVVETKVELLETSKLVKYPLVRISWIISYEGDEIRYGSALIPVWYTVTSMVHEEFSEYLRQVEQFHD